MPIRIGDAELTPCFELFEQGYQICNIKKEEIDLKWFECAMKICLDQYSSDEQNESRNVCIQTITSYYEENIRQQSFIDEFKDIQMTVCISPSNTPAAAVSPTPTSTPTARPTPTQTPTPSTTTTQSVSPTPTSTQTPTPSKTYIPPSKSNTPSITPSPTSSPMCMEWYCENPEDLLTEDLPPRCVYTYEAQLGARRLTDWYCNEWQYKVAMDYGSCYDSCPYGMYTHQPDRTCVYSCPEGYYEDTMSYSCMVKTDGGSGGGSGYCSSGQFYHDNMCVDWCPMGFFADYKNMKCVMQCPSGTFGDSNYWKCLEYCMEPYYGDRASNTCVAQCPEFTAPKDDTRTCESSLVYTCLDSEHRLEGSTCYRYSGAQSRPCCGNGVCEPGKGETFYTCRADCPGTDYATLTWTSQWNGGLTAPQGYGYEVEWSHEYATFDSCIAQCTSELGACVSDWENSARSKCQSYYVNQELHDCLNSISSIVSFQLQSQSGWDARSNAQQQSGCNNGGGWGTGCNYNSWCDSHEDCSCSDCSGDSKCSYNTGCNSNMICESHEDCSCWDCAMDSTRCPGYRRLRKNTHLRNGT
jgi:hypothetical protein